MTLKLCCQCRKLLPLDCFGKNRLCSDGLRYECIACRANRRNALEAGAEKVRPHDLKKRALGGAT